MNDIEDIINYFTGVIEIHGDDNDKKYWNTVLKERQSDKERIKDLEKENEELLEVRVSASANTRIFKLEQENKSKQKAYDDCYCEYKHYKQFDSIPKSLIKEKIEEIEKEFYKLDKEVDIRKPNKTMQDFYEDKERITTMQTLSWVKGILEELLKGE